MRKEKRCRAREREMAGGIGAFWGTRVLEIVKKHDSGGLVWKRIKLTSTRKANAKKRLRRVWQWPLDCGFKSFANSGT
ncbi:hypothetical protein V6N13_080276 [Hibiscus sabdariffa]|uniref:Uncharacterized protein n=1 Tax=Hibiscus sabdariffa TaxID=183260 RepID=A0ABR2PYI2_9ROSI